MKQNLYKGKLTNAFKELSNLRPELTEGDWVMGSLITDADGRTFICTHVTCSNTGIINNGIATVFEVIPESVGECTGIVDIKGKLIFENDIVRTQMYYDRPHSKSRKGKQFVGCVEYHLRTFESSEKVQCPVSNYAERLKVIPYNAEWRVRISEDMGKYGCYSWGEFYECEVLGNKFDNPDLLKVTKQEG